MCIYIYIYIYTHIYIYIYTHMYFYIEIYAPLRLRPPETLSQVGGFPSGQGRFGRIIPIVLYCIVLLLLLLLLL